MRGRSRFLSFSVLVLFVATSCCSANDNIAVKVVGFGECADCKEFNIKSSQAFSGLWVTVDCKLKNGEFKRRGSAKLDAEGKFEVSIPKEILKDGKLNEECYAQLFSTSAAPCQTHSGLQASKIVLVKSGNDGKELTFGTAQNVTFSAHLCSSAFLWPFFKHPPLPPHPWFKKPLPPIPPWFKKPLPPPVPVYKPPTEKPLPPPVPIYKPPVEKPLPPPVPIYKPPVHKPKPIPPPVPIFKPKTNPPPVSIYKPPVNQPKPIPPPVPVYKPPVDTPKPVTAPPTPPVYNPPAPVYTKPLPPFPFFPKPPFPYTKPCPPFAKFPPFPKISLPPLPPHFSSLP